MKRDVESEKKEETDQKAKEENKEREKKGEKYAEETDLKAKEKNKEEKNAKEADQKTKEENKEEHEGEEKSQDEIRNEEENASVAEKENETEVEEKETEEKEGKKDGPNNWQYEGFHAAISSKSSVADQVLIQLGDILDRGEDEIAILSLLRSLDKQEKVQGGAVFQVNGNHETMNVEGDFRYVESGAFDECDDFLEYINISEDDREEGAQEQSTRIETHSETEIEDKAEKPIAQVVAPPQSPPVVFDRPSSPNPQDASRRRLLQERNGEEVGLRRKAGSDFVSLSHGPSGPNNYVSQLGLSDGEENINMGLDHSIGPNNNQQEAHLNLNERHIGPKILPQIHTASKRDGTTAEEQWDPGGDNNALHISWPLQFKQWDPGKDYCCLNLTLRTR